MNKQSIYKIVGMQRDNSVSAFNPQFSYENRNIRILSRDNNTSFSLVNEKGNKKVKVYDNDDKETKLIGKPLGYSILNNYLTIFSKDIEKNKDYIYRINYKDTKFYSKILFSGDLNFSVNNPIDTLSIYENEDIQKVYWLDGINQTRVINIVSREKTISSWNNNSFNFVQELKLKEDISVKKDIVSSGSFTSGTIQYCFSYYNLYGQESNIFYSTPLNYISYNNRGGSPEEKIGNKFTISINNVDTNFDYLRIYSIHRTSLDNTVSTRKVVDIPITNNSIIYTDNGTQGEVVDNTILLYIGGEDVIVQTMAQKDNTLFLGNIKLNRPTLGNIDIDSKKVKDILNNYNIKKFEWDYRKRVGLYEVDQSTKGLYPYKVGLGLNSSNLKHFKYLDTYRLGIQAQYKTGKWSEPVWLNDIKITEKPYSDPKEQVSRLVVPKLTIDNYSLLKALFDNGYRRIRAVIVQPTTSDRDCVAQGVLCPTIYNVKDRANDAPFAQSSWFFRGNPPHQVDEKIDTTYTKDIMNNDENVFLGAWPEFRHNRPLPDNYKRNCEIQILSDRYLTEPYYNVTNGNSTDVFEGVEFVSRFGENYFIDSSIVTFHSPDIEFNDSIQNSIDTSNLKLRIVGKVYLTGTTQDIEVTTLSSPYYLKNPGFYKLPIGNQTYDENGFKQLISAPLYWDATIYGRVTSDKEMTGFVLFPWQANRPLNDDYVGRDDKTEEQLTARFDKKKMSNLKYSAYTDYLDINNIWEAGENDGSSKGMKRGITPITIFNSNEVITTKIQRPLGSNLANISYYGNVDKVLTLTKIAIPTETISTKPDSNNRQDKYVNKFLGYTLTTTDERGKKDNPDQVTFTYLYSTPYGRKLGTPEQADDKGYHNDPVRIKYNSSPHAVFALNHVPLDNKTNDSVQIILPSINGLNRIGSPVGKPFWKNSSSVVHQDNINTSTYLEWEDQQNPLFIGNSGIFYYPNYKANFGTIWLGELYRDIPENERFGGKTEEAFENNIWIPASDPISLTSDDDNLTLKSSIDIVWEEGDTYHQRYDCLKTYPQTLEDQNSVVEILSFLCETRINIDGRYDKNRGNSSNLVATPTNFNLMNTSYSQNNNFFNYRGLDYNKFSLNEFPNSITISKEKTIGEEIDTWTNVTLASTLDLDGDKGEIISLKNFNNEIISFQEKGIANILFNSRVQIPVTGDNQPPIEISNNYKLEGKRYITNKLGTKNKWGIVDTPNGIYFIDELSKSINLLNNGINNISDSLGFHSWCVDNIPDTGNWNPNTFNNFVSFYDNKHKDLYFTNIEESLNYSELTNQFISFFDYGNTPFMFNYRDKFLALKSTDNEFNIWEQNAGRYNEYFGEFKPYYVTLVVNPDIVYDKTFTNIEFRSDRWSEDNNLISNETFDTLSVWNEYQKGVSSLNNFSVSPLSLKRKFRIWRSFIPRDISNPLRRIRNTWIYLKLETNKENYNKNILHDIIVNYII